MATITEDYVSFETAKLLKEKGFNYPCRVVYSPKGIVKHYLKEEVYAHHLKGHKKLCPTLQMAMKWLRKYHNIIIDPEPVWNGKKWEYQLFIVTPQNADSPYYEHNPYKTYEECVETAIKYCLENLIK